MKKSISYHASQAGTFLLGGTLPIHRLGFGAMRLTRYRDCGGIRKTQRKRAPF